MILYSIKLCLSLQLTLKAELELGTVTNTHAHRIWDLQISSYNTNTAWDATSSFVIARSLVKRHIIVVSNILQVSV